MYINYYISLELIKTQIMFETFLGTILSSVTLLGNVCTNDMLHEIRNPGSPAIFSVSLHIYSRQQNLPNQQELCVYSQKICGKKKRWTSGLCNQLWKVWTFLEWLSPLCNERENRIKIVSKTIFFAVKDFLLFFLNKRQCNEINSFSIILDFQNMTVILYHLKIVLLEMGTLGLQNFHFAKISFQIEFIFKIHTLCFWHLQYLSFVADF